MAYDYCVLGLRGERLAKHRHLSPATLAQRIQQAKEAGYIREAVLNIPQTALEEIYPYLYRIDLLALATQGEATSQLYLPAPAYIPQGFMENANGEKVEIGVEM